jgi:hypothetical protein
VPAAAGRREVRVYHILVRHTACLSVQDKLKSWIILSVTVKCLYIRRTADSEGTTLDLSLALT